MDSNKNNDAIQEKRPGESSERIPGGVEESKKKINPPYVILSVAFLILAVIGLTFFLVKHWEGSSEFYIDTTIDTETETDDRISLLPAEIYREDDDGITTVVIFGNDTFGDNTDGVSVVKLLQENSTATIYDCTFPGSYMCTMTEGGPGESGYPEDWFCLYWLWECTKNGDLKEQKAAMDRMEGIDKELYKEHLKTLESIDFNKVDFILLCYDAHDYLMGHPYYAIGDEYNPVGMNGVLYGINEKVRGNYPGIQLALVSPSYCYAVDKNGKKGGNLVKIKGQTLADVLMFLKTRTIDFGIAYVDDYFGVKINEDTADLYLVTDNVVPNLEGKKLIAAHVLNKVLRRIEVQK